MDLGAIPLFSMLRDRLGYLSERQRVIAQNVSNSDTPGYTPSDLKAFSFTAAMSGQLPMAKTQAAPQPGHMTAPGARQVSFKSIRTKDSETTLDGNSVVLEEEMLRMSEARMSYDAAISFYQKSLNMIRLAARAPGR